MSQPLDHAASGGGHALADMRRGTGFLSRVFTRPSVWVALAVLALPFGSQLAPGGATATPSDAALVVALVVSVVALLRGEGSRLGAHALRCARSVPALGLLLVAVATTVVTVLAHNYPTSVLGGVRFLELFTLAPFAIMVALRTRTDVVIVLGSLVGLALGEGALGVWQYLTGTGAGYGAEAVRAVGTFGAYNITSLATLCGLGLIAALAVAVVRTGRQRLVAGAAAAALTLPLAVSLSRGVYVAAAVAAVVVLSRGRIARLLVVVGIGAALAALVGPALIASGGTLGDRLGSLVAADAEPDQSVIDRLSLWGAAEKMALDHPFTGIGPRAFPDHRDAYADLSLLGSSDISFGSSFERVELESPHDLYLLIASEQGLLVALAYMVLLAVLLARSLTAAARRRSDGSTTLALVAAGTLTLELVILLTADLGGPGSIFIALTMGLAARGAADLDLEGRRPAWSLRLGGRRTGSEAAHGGRVVARPDALVPMRLESPV